MARSLALSIFTPSILLTAALPGCATYQACGAGECSGDQKMNSEVARLLDGHPELAGPIPITVQSKDGIVYLHGMVATDLQRDAAESVAREAAGVTMVVNGIAVTEK